MVVILVLAVGFVSAFATLLRWRWGLYALFLFTPFIGVAVLLSDRSAVTLLAKDFSIVLPLYLSLFLLRPGELVNLRELSTIIASAALFAFLAMLFMASPTVPSFSVAILGLKVWLMYIPLLFCTFSLVRRDPFSLVRIFRFALVVGMIPCLVGLSQWFGASIFGYRETIEAIYSVEAARQATQGYAEFDLGGAIRRIPSTFTNGASYFIYGTGIIAMAFGTWRNDPSPKWRRFGLFILILGTFATLASGQRSAFLLTPILIVTAFAMSTVVSRIFSLVLISPVVLVGAVYLLGFDPIPLFDELLFGGLAGPTWALEELATALTDNILGNGTGTNTNAARYLLESGAVDGSARGYYETYISKAAFEMGIPGVVSLLFLFLMMLIAAVRAVIFARGTVLSHYAAGLFSFVLLVLLLSFRGWPLDVDPGNILFWVFFGFLLAIGNWCRDLRPSQAPLRTRFRHHSNRPVAMGGELDAGPNLERLS